MRFRIGMLAAVTRVHCQIYNLCVNESLVMDIAVLEGESKNIRAGRPTIERLETTSKASEI